MMRNASKDGLTFIITVKCTVLLHVDMHAQITSNILCETSTRHQLQMENLYTCCIIIKLSKTKKGKSRGMTGYMLFFNDCTRGGQTLHNWALF